MSKLKEESKNSSPNCSTMLPLALAPPPFFRQAKPNIQLFITSASHVVDQFHKAMLSSADEFLNTVRILASKNPFLSKIIAFSSHVQSFKIPCRKYGTSNSLHNHNFAAILPGDSVAGVVAANGILNFLNLYNTILICRLVLTWFPNAPPAIVSPLSTLCDPYLNIFRGLIPPLGGTLDLSPILAFLVLNAFTSAASALPAELPSPGSPHDLQSHLPESHSTASQRKWMRRLAGGNKPRDS